MYFCVFSLSPVITSHDGSLLARLGRNDRVCHVIGDDGVDVVLFIAGIVQYMYI